MADVNPLKEDGTPKSPEEIAQEEKEKGLNPAEPGSKTDPALLLKSLKEEREKRTELENRIQELEIALDSSGGDSSAEGRVLQKQISEVKDQIESLSMSLAKKDIFIEYPLLKEKSEEFKTFLNDPENKGMNIKTAAKAFLAENGLLDPVRKGLEKPTGGPREQTTAKMSIEDIKNLRETNFKKYQQMLENGEIVI